MTEQELHDVRRVVGPVPCIYTPYETWRSVLLRHVSIKCKDWDIFDLYLAGWSVQDAINSLRPAS